MPTAARGCGFAGCNSLMSLFPSHGGACQELSHVPIEPWWETNPATTPRQELGMVSPEIATEGYWFESSRVYSSSRLSGVSWVCPGRISGLFPRVPLSPAETPYLVMSRFEGPGGPRLVPLASARVF